MWSPLQMSYVQNSTWGCFFFYTLTQTLQTCGLDHVLDTLVRSCGKKWKGWKGERGSDLEDRAEGGCLKRTDDEWPWEMELIAVDWLAPFVEEFDGGWNARPRGPFVSRFPGGTLRNVVSMRGQGRAQRLVGWRPDSGSLRKDSCFVTV